MAYFTLWYGEMIPFLQKSFKGREAEMYPIASALINTLPPALADYVDAELKVELLKSLFADYFEKYDVLLCPVLPFTAQPITTRMFQRKTVACLTLVALRHVHAQAAYKICHRRADRLRAVFLDKMNAVYRDFRFSSARHHHSVFHHAGTGRCGRPGDPREDRWTRRWPG